MTDDGRKVADFVMDAASAIEDLTTELEETKQLTKRVLQKQNKLKSLQQQGQREMEQLTKRMLQKQNRLLDGSIQIQDLIEEYHRDVMDLFRRQEAAHVEEEDNQDQEYQYINEESDIEDEECSYPEEGRSDILESGIEEGSSTIVDSDIATVVSMSSAATDDTLTESTCQDLCITAIRPRRPVKRTFGGKIMDSIRHFTSSPAKKMRKEEHRLVEEMRGRYPTEVPLSIQPSESLLSLLQRENEGTTTFFLRQLVNGDLMVRDLLRKVGGWFHAEDSDQWCMTINGKPKIKYTSYDTMAELFESEKGQDLHVKCSLTA